MKNKDVYARPNTTWYGKASMCTGLIPIVLFPMFIWYPWASLGLSLVAILLGLLSVKKHSGRSGVVGLILGILGLLYMSILILIAVTS